MILGIRDNLEEEKFTVMKKCTVKILILFSFSFLSAYFAYNNLSQRYLQFCLRCVFCKSFQECRGRDSEEEVMGQFDTEDNLTPRTIWHRPCKEDNLTPRTIWHRGQFDTIMQNRTIWHRPCREDNLTPRTIWHRGQFDTIINFIFLQLFGPQIWLEIYWLPLSIFLTENYPV